MKRTAHDAYAKAFAEVIARIEAQLRSAPGAALPVRMYVAGGAALHLHTGARVTEDVDATFSQRVLLGDDVEVAYRDADGRARVLYLDRNYNDSLGLMHEKAFVESRRIDVPGVDRRILEVRVLTPLDLAVTKLSRFTDQDRRDIELLAKEGLIDSRRLRERADEALAGYVGDTSAVRTSIEVACTLIDATAPGDRPGRRRKKRR